jgi:hypothetical protein
LLASCAAAGYHERASGVSGYGKTEVVVASLAQDAVRPLEERVRRWVRAVAGALDAEAPAPIGHTTNVMLVGEGAIAAWDTHPAIR